MRKSQNSGTSFAPAVELGSAGGVIGPPLQFRYLANIPSIATDPLNSQRVYVTWASSSANGGQAIVFRASLDGGANWLPALTLAPKMVTDDPVAGANVDQFFPWISVAPNGMLQVMWADDRLDPSTGRRYDIRMAQSSDQGANFSKNFRLTTYQSDPEWDGFPDGLPGMPTPDDPPDMDFIGDYNGLSSSGVAVWSDQRSEGIHQDIYGSPRCHLDVDVSHTTQALSDGVLCLRFLFNFTGNALTSGAIGPNAQRPSADEIVAYLNGCKDSLKDSSPFLVSDSMLDVDGNGFNDALTDGLLILRYLFGFTGSFLIQGVVGPGCTRCTATQIEAFLALFTYLA